MSRHGWAVGCRYPSGDSLVLATSNGGTTWRAQNTGNAYGLFGVAFVDAKHGWAVGDFGTILVTANGGATWTAQQSGTDRSLNSVAFANADRGWVAGDGGSILVTTSGGAAR